MKTIILCGLNSKVQTTTVPYSTTVDHKKFIFYLVNFKFLSTCPVVHHSLYEYFFFSFYKFMNFLVEYEFIHRYNFFLILMWQNYYLCF
jgi:hypothetical protein